MKKGNRDKKAKENSDGLTEMRRKKKREKENGADDAAYVIYSNATETLSFLSSLSLVIESSLRYYGVIGSRSINSYPPSCELTLTRRSHSSLR